MRIVIGILKNGTKEVAKTNAYNYQLEQDAYNVYKRLSRHSLKAMISWRDGVIKKLRDEIKSIQEPILNALKRALKEKNE
jgi:hypothetical protein